MTVELTLIRLYLDPTCPGLAYAADDPTDDAGYTLSGPAGPDRAGVGVELNDEDGLPIIGSGYGGNYDAAHVADLNAAVAALEPWAIGEPDTRNAGANGLLAVVAVASKDIAAACRALEALR